VKGLWLVIACVATIALASASQAAAGDRIEGHWQGKIQDLIRIRLHVARAGDRYTASLDSPDQGANGLAIDTLAFSSDSLRFEMRMLRADYAGRMSADGGRIDGRWRQAGNELPLVFARMDSVPADRRPQEPTGPLPYDTTEVRVDNAKAGVHLAGTLTMPRGQAKFPAVVLISGSGAEDRDESLFGHRPFLVLADHLTRNGIAVLRLDDRGVGGSSGNVSTSTIDDFAGDALAAVAWLRRYPGVDSTRVGLIGHSEGGLVAPLAATRSKDVAYIVLLAGPGIPIGKLLDQQGVALLRAGGAGDSAIAHQRAIQRRIFELVRGEPDSARLAQRVHDTVIESVAALPANEREWISDPEAFARQQVAIATSPWFRYLLDYDPAPTLRQVRVPVLALNGAKDLQVDADANLAAITSAVRSNPKADLTVKKLPDLNHLFQTCETGALTEYARIEETFSPVALREVSTWIHARKGSARSAAKAKQR